MIARRTPIRRTPLKRKPRRYVVPPEVLKYWDWMRTEPCLICARWFQGHGLKVCCKYQYSKTEVGHVGMRGIGQKCDPWEVLPLCGVLHHRLGPYSHHVLGKKFFEFHGLDRMQLIREYRERYFSLIGHPVSRVPESVRPGEGLS